jgi:hypothetical protein
MKLTTGGLAVSYVIGALSFASLVFRDVLLEGSIMVLVLIVGVEMAWVKLATQESNYALTHQRTGDVGQKVILYPGDSSAEHVFLTKKVGGRVEIKGEISFLHIKPEVTKGVGRFALEFRFRTEYAGDYSGNKVSLKIISPLGLLSSGCEVNFRTRYVVYPRVLQVAAATIRLLNTAEIGETPVPIPGIGSEYYEMRNYLPTDDVRNVNWKASARRGEPVVIERMKEVGASFLLILDARGGGFADADRLGSTFLSIANSLAASDVSFGILVHDGASVSVVSSLGDNRTSLALALKAALGIIKTEIGPELLELLPLGAPGTAQTGGADSFLTQMHEVRASELRESLGSNDPWTAAATYLREAQVRSLVYVSALPGDIKPLIELVWRSWHQRNVDFAVANACESKEADPRYRKLALALRTAGARYFQGEPLDLARRILTS